MPHRSLKHRIGPFALARTLSWLRLCAIGGQSIAVLVCTYWLRLPIPLLPLLCCIGLLSLFAVLAAWRLWLPWPVREWEIVGHIGVDTLVLGVLLYLTGGGSNPFVTLLVVPVALCAAALSVPAILAVATLAGAAYLALMRWYVALPMPHGMHGESFDLHVAGMGVNLVVTALLLGFFINRLARALRMQQLATQRMHERALRDEGILAIATQAAGAAHELNTPLSTLRTLLPELRRKHAGDVALAEDLALLEGQVDRCRDILREMVAFGRAQLSQEPEQLDVVRFLHGCTERFQLLRPEAELELQLDAGMAHLPLCVPPSLRHALLNLLNNAADASAQRESREVRLDVTRDGSRLQFAVTDRGPGFASTEGNTRLSHSRKQAGLGLGLTLAEATAERLGGELTARNTGDGAVVCLRLPLTIISRH